MTGGMHSCHSHSFLKDGFQRPQTRFVTVSFHFGLRGGFPQENSMTQRWKQINKGHMLMSCQEQNVLRFQPKDGRFDTKKNIHMTAA